MKQTCMFLVMFWLTVQCKASCDMRNEHYYQCGSIQDVSEAGLQNEWTELMVRKSGNQNLDTLLPNDFLNVPNIDRLYLVGSINGIKYNAFKNLDKLSTIEVVDCDLTEIKNGMFTNLPINRLLLYSSKIKSLKPRSFDNMPNLRKLYIYKNVIPHIQAGIFSYTNLEILYLNDNEIKSIEEETFFGMNNLRILAIESNHLTTFLPDLYIGDSSPDLTVLWLARNNLTEIVANQYVNYPKLRLLLLQINSIRKIEDNSFNKLQNIKYIDLSNNQLDILRPSIFSSEGLTRMDTIFIHNNRLTSLSSDVLDKLPRLRKITIGGNPWQCLCYEKLRKLLEDKDIEILCDDEYFDGTRPVCITPEGDASVCEYNESNATSLYEQFIDATRDYEVLPKLCRINCENNKKCYSDKFDVPVLFNYYM